jgi:putative photosynthetic complex assembly protein 2
MDVISALTLILYVIAGWWGATGLILYLVRRSGESFHRTLAVGSALAVLALAALQASSRSATTGGACIAFGAILVIWGWLEISFLFGVVTGPRRTACDPGCHGLPRLRYAIEAILYHELATIAAAAIVVALTWHAPNSTGLWTFMLLWGMRISAKLNLFLGVPNTGEIMLPAHLAYLGSFFRRRRLNVLFPISMLVTTLLCLQLIGAASHAGNADFRGSELTLLATLASLAWLEHWMLVLPMRADTPWKFTRGAVARGAVAPAAPDPLL